MTVNELLKFGYRLLGSSSPSPELDADLLLANILKLNRTTILANPQQPLSVKSALYFLYQIRKRKLGLPVAYLTGKREFYGRNFLVNKNTLVPRPDTEILIDEVKNIVRQNNQINRIIDLGTGSGCLAITLALELPSIKILASDISNNAVALAKKNASHYNLTDQISFRIGDLITDLALPEIDNHTILIANLPYLLKREITGDLKYEPYKALYGGADGLLYFRKLFNQLKARPLKFRPLFIILEINPLTIKGLNELIKEIMPEVDFSYIKDLNNYIRILKITSKIQSPISEY